MSRKREILDRLFCVIAAVYISELIISCNRGTVTISARTCEAPHDCYRNELCIRHQCIRPCRGHEDCSPGYLCSDSGACVPADAFKGQCGNSLVEGPEECDLGKANSDQGDCTSKCNLAHCGDGLIQAGIEECDDGNTVSEDVCTADCHINLCGDGIPGGPNEECDDGNQIQEDGCSNNCRRPGCGNSVIEPGLGEECDDGNDDNNDDCLSYCVKASCGDLFIWRGHEQCDSHAGNRDNDECTSTCQYNVCGDGLVWDRVEECDIGRHCNDGQNCTHDPSICRGIGDGECQVLPELGCRPNFCTIERDWCCIDLGECIRDGVPSPNNPCLQCLPNISKTSWSSAEDQACDDSDPCTENDTCKNGVCTGQPKNCEDQLACNGVSTCVDGACQPGTGLCTGTRYPFCLEAGVCPPAAGPLCGPVWFPIASCHQCLSAADCGRQVGPNPWRCEPDLARQHFICRNN